MRKKLKLCFWVLFKKKKTKRKKKRRNNSSFINAKKNKINIYILQHFGLPRKSLWQLQKEQCACLISENTLKIQYPFIVLFRNNSFIKDLFKFITANNFRTIAAAV